MFKFASSYVYVKQSLKQALQGKIEEIKEEDNEIDSDDLNASFDSDSEQKVNREELKGNFSYQYLSLKF